MLAIGTLFSMEKNLKTGIACILNKHQLNQHTCEIVLIIFVINIYTQAY